MVSVKSRPMKKKYYPLLFLYIVLFIFFLLGRINSAFSQSNTSKVCQTITDKIVKDLTLKLPDFKLITKYSAALKPDGSWPDIDYTSKAYTVWPPNEHLVRLQTLIKAYVTKGSLSYADGKIFTGITSALQYWYSLDPKSDNWWFNQISTPQSIGESLILMRSGDKKLDKELLGKLIERMKQGNPEKWTGANKKQIFLSIISTGPY